MTYRCPYCDKIYNLVRNLNRHKRRKHFDDLEYRCPFCERFASDSVHSLRIHVGFRHNSRLQEFDNIRNNRRLTLRNGRAHKVEEEIEI